MIDRKKISSELYFDEIKRNLKLLEISSEINNLSKIMKGCRLLSSEFLKRKVGRTEFIENWYDEFHCHFKINKSDKKVNIKLNCIDQEEIYHSDIYFGLSIEKILKISNLCYLYIGESWKDKIYYVSFLGIDGFLRSFYNDGDGWKRISSLFLGIEILKLIFADAPNFKKLNAIYNIDAGCADGSAWLSYLPVDDEEIKNLNDPNLKFLLNK